MALTSAAFVVTAAVGCGRRFPAACKKSFDPLQVRRAHFRWTVRGRHGVWIHGFTRFTGIFAQRVPRPRIGKQRDVAPSYFEFTGHLTWFSYTHNPRPIKCLDDNPTHFFSAFM